MDVYMPSESPGSDSSGLSDFGEWDAPGEEQADQSQNVTEQAASARDETLAQHTPTQQPRGAPQKPEYPPEEPISGWWKYALASLIGTPLMFLVFFGSLYLYFAFPGKLAGAVMTITFLGIVVVRLILPYALYKDSKAIARSDVAFGWHPSSTLYLVGSLFVPPPFEYMTASMYLYRRHKIVGRP